MNPVVIPKKYHQAALIVCGSLVVLLSAVPPNTRILKSFELESEAPTQNILTNAPAQGDSYGNTKEILNFPAIAGFPDNDFDEKEETFLLNAGSAYIYQQDKNGNWNRTQKIVASDRAATDLFGWSAAISEDYAVVTAPYDDVELSVKHSRTTSGSAYIFARNKDGSWVEKQKIRASDLKPNCRFGLSASISEKFIIVGAYEKEAIGAKKNSSYQIGSAYIFERNGNGIWNEVQKIDAGDQYAGDRFGYAVSISENHAIIETRSRPLNTRPTNENSDNSTAYIYERSSSGTWEQIEKLTNPQRTIDIMDKLY